MYVVCYLNLIGFNNKWFFPFTIENPLITVNLFLNLYFFFARSSKFLTNIWHEFSFYKSVSWMWTIFRMIEAKVIYWKEFSTYYLVTVDFFSTSFSRWVLNFCFTLRIKTKHIQQWQCFMLLYLLSPSLILIKYYPSIEIDKKANKIKLWNTNRNLSIQLD